MEKMRGITQRTAISASTLRRTMGEIEGGLATANPAREVSYRSGGSDGFRIWTIEEVNQHEAVHPVGCKSGPKEWQLPILPQLRTIIDTTPIGAASYLLAKSRRPLSATGFGNRFRKWCVGRYAYPMACEPTRSTSPIAR